MTVDWNKGSIDKSGSMENVSRRSGGEYPIMLDEFWFYLAIAVCRLITLQNFRKFADERLQTKKLQKFWDLLFAA
jgi:hypothetical protein